MGETGEAASGRYFFTTDLVITPWPGITAMIEAIDGLVCEGAISNACQVVPDPELEVPQQEWPS